MLRRLLPRAPVPCLAAALLGGLSCGGAADADVLGALSGGTTSTVRSDPPADPGVTSQADDPAADDVKEAVPTKEEGNDEPEPEPEPPSCEAEKEDNGSESKANALGPCMRGTLSGINDKDYFRLPVEQTGRIIMQHSSQNGTIQYTVTEENGAIVTGLNVKFTDRAPDISVEAGKAYFFMVSFPDLTAPNAGPRGYEFRVSVR